MKNNNIINLILRLWVFINPKRKKQFVLLTILMVATSISEIFSIGALVPFLSVISTPDLVLNNTNAIKMLNVLNIKNSTELIFYLSFIFCTAVIISAIFRLALLWGNTRLSFATGADLSVKIYRNILYQPYSVHVKRNSSEVINLISMKANAVTFSVLNPLLSVISAVIMALLIISTLLYIDPLMVTLGFMGVGSTYFIVIKITKGKLAKNSNDISKNYTNVIKALQEGIGGIRDVLIDGIQEKYINLYKKSDEPLRSAQGSNLFIGGSPRIAIEGIGTVLIALLALGLSLKDNGILSVIPVLGAIALSIQRLLPILQSMYVGWVSIKGSQDSLIDALAILESEPEIPIDFQLNGILSFKKNIEFKNVSFRYGENLPWVLKNINLVITQGSRVGVYGKTGSGKSTLLDILMGLIEPTIGVVKVDGVTIGRGNSQLWRKHIGHVPQSIFLSDATILENIAFGSDVENIEIESVRNAARSAQLEETIEKFKEGYETIVGERGIQLSGGQRQRIGIARAIYKSADCIILDEATSALDNDTEAVVMDNINKFDDKLTIIMVAHRLTTLTDCDFLIEVKSGQISLRENYKK